MATGDVDPAAAEPVRMNALGRWLRLLSTPIDGASLGVFRIVFGLAVAIDALRYLAYGWVDLLYVQPAMHFHYLGFEFVEPWPGRGMHLHFGAITVLALLVAAGLFHRAAAAALFVAYLYVFLLDQAAYMNHHYLMLLIAFLLALMPAGAYAWTRPEAPKPAIVPLWTVWLLRFQLVVVYVYSALAKLDPDWLRGQPMRSTLERMTQGASAPVTDVGAPLLAYGIAYGGLLTDFAIPLLLSFRRTRWPGIAIAVVFHGANAIALNIGVFSYWMLGMLPIFFAPDWPRRLARRWARQPHDERTSPAAVPTPAWLLVLLHIYVAVQLLVPLRHWLYPGPVRWTEEGHRFSWRMMLRTKRSQINLRAVDPDTGRSWSIDPADDLTRVQLRELETFPDLVLQYAHVHRDRLRREGVRAPQIRVDWFCSLNGRPAQRLADPEVDLARVERTLRPASWLLPLPREP
jgi:hypothetical protein